MYFFIEVKRYFIRRLTKIKNDRRQFSGDIGTGALHQCCRVFFSCAWVDELQAIIDCRRRFFVSRTKAYAAQKLISSATARNGVPEDWPPSKKRFWRGHRLSGPIKNPPAKQEGLRVNIIHRLK